MTELSKGKKAAIKRARLLTEFEWTPIRDVSVYTKKDGKTTLKAGEPLKGMIYSSTEPNDKFICENVSFETFRTIVNNADSALYEKNLGGFCNAWPYFGVVCNGFVRFALNLSQYRYSTKIWLTVPGMKEIAKPGKYTVDELEVCDILYAYGNGRNHVAMVTDIVKDENGKVCGIEVSEAVQPLCKREEFSPEKYYEEFKLFGICRYEYIDSVPEPDDSFMEFFDENSVSKNPVISLDYGNKSNYRTNEEVVISANDEVEIFKDGKILKKIMIKGKISQRFEKGYYEAKSVSNGKSVLFCVTEPLISHVVNDGIITVNASACDDKSRIHHFEFREAGNEALIDNRQADACCNMYCSALSKVEELTAEEKETGIIRRRIPENAKNFKVSFENEYGIWTHTMININCISEN